MAGGTRSALRLVQSDEVVAPWQRFCSACGSSGGKGATPASRVCEECELGLILHAPPEAAPTEHEAFLVIDTSLTIQALSFTAESLLAINERDAVNRLVTELLIPASPDVPGAHLAVAIVEAASGAAGEVVTQVIVRPSRTFGIRLEGRIAPCGDPPAALLVLS